MLGLLAPLYVFGQRAQKAAYSQMEGQPGAAAAALRMLRRGWKTEPTIGFTKQQDFIHRVVGPPGIILIGDGNPNRLRQLMATERKKHERVAAETPVHEVWCGNGEGQVPLPKLVRHVQKLGRQVKPAELTDVLLRLKALDAQRSHDADPQGSGADQHEGHARQHARPLSPAVAERRGDVGQRRELRQVRRHAPTVDPAPAASKVSSCRQPAARRRPP